MVSENISYYQDSELQKFASKIRTPVEILNNVGIFPREQKVALFHGIFDPIHPGHRRLLDYLSRDFPNITLIVGVASDDCITQTLLPPPYMPQGLRALNIAAVGAVDHVFISKSTNPLIDISTFKPDYLVRGYSNNDTESFLQEKQVVVNYGGEIIIVPGDTNYPSQQLVENSISLAPEQLLNLQILMKAEDVSFEDLKKTIQSFSEKSAHVIGDLIIDKYRNCTHLGQNSKGPYPSVKQISTQTYVGGAGVVAKHLQSLGLSTTFTTIIGTQRNMDLAEFAINNLQSLNVQVEAISDHNRPTTVKERIIENHRVLVQIDDLENSPLRNELILKICQSIARNPSDAIICSDFRHGIFNDKSAKRFGDNIPKGVLRIADSQVSSRWGNILDFAGFDLITPNEKEARFALGDQDTPIGPLVQRLHLESNCRFLILKLGEDGLITHQRAEKGLRAGFPLPSFATHIIDAVGAGDALLAAASATLAVSNNITQAAILGNLCAAIECSKQGNIPVTKEELFYLTEELEKSLK